MQAEVLAIGDELTHGQRLDTNSQWLARQLGGVGIGVAYITVVGDDLKHAAAALRLAAARSDLVIITGGLGPTADDLTRQAIAEAAGLELRLNQRILRQLRQRFAERGRKMPKSNEIQAHFPEGSREIPNPHGTAPGIDLAMAPCSETGHRCRLFALPGVPAEMKQMWQQYVEPILASLGGEGRVIRHHRLKCFGVGESELESMLPNLIRRGRQPQVGITVHQATITLRVTAEGTDAEHCWQSMQPTLAIIRQKLGRLVFGEEEDELQHAVVQALRSRRETLAVCEWGTRGLVARWLKEVDDGDDPSVDGAAVVSSSDGLRVLLGAPAEALPRDSKVLASWMASTIRTRCQSDYGLAIGPVPHHSQTPPQIALAFATAAGVCACDRSFAGHPDLLLPRAAKYALDLVRLHFAGEDSRLDANAAGQRIS